MKFTPEKGTIEIRCELLRPDNDGNQFIRIEVIDSGIGISDNDMAKMFKLFGCV